MSKDAFAGVYTNMLNDEGFRDQVADDPAVLDVWDLTDDEKGLLVDEANTEVAGFSIGSGGAMGYLSSGPLLSPSVASGLGSALNSAAGLPTGALAGPGFVADAGCCPWNKSVIAPGSMVE